MKRKNGFYRDAKYCLSTIFFILLLLSCKVDMPQKVTFRVPPDGATQGPSGPDTTPPSVVIGISFTSIAANSLTVNWGAAFDNHDSQASLQYKLVKDNASTSNINTIEKANAKTGSDLLLDWAVNVTSHNVSGLAGLATYHFVVLVKDTAENIRLYTPQSETTAPLGSLTSPTFTPAAGIYASAQDVTITSASSGVTICYTSNGSTPTATTSGTCSNGTSLANGGSFSLSTEGATTVRAVATKAEYTTSSMSSREYIIDTTPPAAGSITTPASNVISAGHYTFGWTTGSDSGGSGLHSSTRYRLFTYTNNTCSAGEENRGTTTYTSMLVTFSAQSQYWARVTYMDNAGNITQSACSTFSVTASVVGPVYYYEGSWYYDGVSGTFEFDPETSISPGNCWVNTICDGVGFGGFCPNWVPDPMTMTQTITLGSMPSSGGVPVVATIQYIESSSDCLSPFGTTAQVQFEFIVVP